MTFDYKIIPARNTEIDSVNEINDFRRRKSAVSRKLKRDRRKYKKDRRSSVRDGVIVSLSFKSNRRNGSDRRRQISRFA